MTAAKRFGAYLALLAFLFLQVTVLNDFKLFNIKPDLMMILVVFCGLFFGAAAGFEIGLAAGLFKDIFSLDIFWLNTLIFALTGLLAGALGAKVFKESRTTQFLLVLFLTGLSMSVHYTTASVLLGSVNFGFGGFLSASVIPASLYTAALSIPIFFKFVQFYDLKEDEGLF